jgi:short subunit fatty acids transporter
MSNTPLSSDSASLEESPTTIHRLIARLGGFSAALRTAGRALGFWTAVIVPLFYLPLLTVLTTTQDLFAFLLLLLVNVVGLLAGRNYRRN